MNATRPLDLEKMIKKKLQTEIDKIIEVKKE